MGIKIGVVCEGSHDYAVLKTFAERICESVSVSLDAFDALQPEVSATFAQIGTGGWGAIKGWCKTRNGTFYRTFLDKPLFANSPTYDILLIHIDGDVFDICETGPLAGKTTSGMQYVDVVAQLEDVILKSWLSIRAQDVQKVTVCVPVRHLEAWLLAGLTTGTDDLESKDTKELFRQIIGPAYPGKALQLYQNAAIDAVAKIDNIRTRCISFSTFETKFAALLA